MTVRINLNTTDIKMTEKNKLEENIEKLCIHFERANFSEFVELLSKPWKFMWLNFLAGLFRGLGTAVGLTVVFALAIYVVITVLSHFIAIPIIGSYIAQLVAFVNESLHQGVKP